MFSTDEMAIETRLDSRFNKRNAVGIICNCALQIYGFILSNSEIRQNMFCS